MFLEGSLLALIWSEGAGLHGSPSRVLLGSQSEEFGWFPSVSTSSTPIRVDTKEVGPIHVLYPTLKYSFLMSSPAAPGLTSPRALRSRVLQALSTSEDVRRVLREDLDFHLRNRALRVLLEQVVHLRSPSIISSSLPSASSAASRLWGAQAPNLSLCMMRDVLALHMEYPPSLSLIWRIRLRIRSVFWVLQVLAIFFKKSCLFMIRVP